jgi:hypothetical protein
MRMNSIFRWLWPSYGEVIVHDGSGPWRKGVLGGAAIFPDLFRFIEFHSRVPRRCSGGCYEPTCQVLLFPYTLQGCKIDCFCILVDILRARDECDGETIQKEEFR